MITHGNKQISEIVYARKASEGGGAVLLTNIIRGAQVVFGGLYPYWKLLPATKAAILAAFGQMDGNAVIKATNAYLNALAETDPTKATALAGFINEDPMLVCSLVPTLGYKRYICSTGSQYFKLGLKPTTSSYVIARFRLDNSNTTYPWAFGTENPSKSIRFGVWLNATNLATRFGSLTKNISRSNVNNPLDIVAKDGNVTINGEHQGTFTLRDGIDYEMYLFAVNLNNNATGDGGSMYGSFEYFEMDGHVFIPFKRNNVMEMIDLTTGTLATRVGTFTESIEYIPTP